MLSAFMNRLIEQPVGNNMANKNEDVRRVKSALGSLGCFDYEEDPEPHGFVTRQMDHSIKSFQKEKDLKIDGILRPGGETEQALIKETQTGSVQKNVHPQPHDRQENEQEEPDCENYEIALANAIAIFEQAKTNLDKVESEKEKLQEALAEIEKQIAELELAKEPIDNALRFIGSSAGAIGGGLAGRSLENLRVRHGVAL